MPRNGFLVILFFLALCSCKKDVLHWRQVETLNSNTSSRLNNIRFLNDSVCIIAGGIDWSQSDIVRSSDGGYTWKASTNNDAGKEMFGMGVATNGCIYLSGADGDILHSADSGKTWQFNRINNWLVYNGGTFINNNLGIFISTVLQRECTITRVDSNFNIVDEKTFLFGLNRFYPINELTAYVIGYGTVMKTIDAGSSWNFLNVDGDNFTGMDIHGENIWMCGANGGIYHSVNGGDTWSQLRNGDDFTIPHYGLRSIVFTNSQNGWAVGDDGIVIRTDDYGYHWEEYDRFTTSTLRSIVICPNGDLLVTGDKGVLFRLYSF